MNALNKNASPQGLEPLISGETSGGNQIVPTLDMSVCACTCGCSEPPDPPGYSEGRADGRTDAAHQAAETEGGGEN